MIFTFDITYGWRLYCKLLLDFLDCVAFVGILVFRMGLTCCGIVCIGSDCVTCMWFI